MKDEEIQLIQKMIDAHNIEYGFLPGQHLHVRRFSDDTLDIIRGDKIADIKSPDDALNAIAENAKECALQRVKKLRITLANIVQSGKTNERQ